MNSISFARNIRDQVSFRDFGQKVEHFLGTSSNDEEQGFLSKIATAIRNLLFSATKNDIAGAYQTLTTDVNSKFQTYESAFLNSSFNESFPITMDGVERQFGISQQRLDNGQFRISLGFANDQPISFISKKNVGDLFATLVSDVDTVLRNQTNISTEQHPIIFKLVANCVRGGMLSVEDVKTLSKNFKQRFYMDSAKQVVEFIYPNISEKERDALVSALLAWCESPSHQQQLTFQEVVDYPEHAKFFMEYHSIRDMIFHRTLTKDEFFSSKVDANVRKLLLQSPVKEGLAAKNFTLDALFDKAHILVKIAERNEDAYKTPEYDEPMAYYFEHFWQNKITLQDCLTIDNDPKLRKLRVVLDKRFASQLAPEFDPSKQTLAQFMEKPK